VAVATTSLANHCFGVGRTLDRIVVHVVGAYFLVRGLFLGPEFALITLLAAAVLIAYWARWTRRDQEHALLHVVVVAAILLYIACLVLRGSRRQRRWF
jgi:hypothetical protein